MMRLVRYEYAATEVVCYCDNNLQTNDKKIVTVFFWSCVVLFTCFKLHWIQ